MADEDKDITIIPRVKMPGSGPAENELPWQSKLSLFGIVFGGFLLMLVLATFLPLEFPLKVLALLIGSFLLIDLHKTLKSKIL